MDRAISEYTVSVDNIDSAVETQLVLNFDDANLFQTSSYCIGSGKNGNVSILALKHGSEVVAVAFIRIYYSPMFHIGIAYVRWGPLWKMKDHECNTETFRQMLKALKEEYAHKRGLLLRIIPNQTEKDKYNIKKILLKEGFVWKPSPYRTLILDITSPLESIRSKFKPSWRKQLNKSERNNLKVVDGTEDRLFEIIEGLYGEMLNRKKFLSGTNVFEFRKIQQLLPSELKMKVFICQYDNQPTAGIFGSAIGDTGIELIAATGDHGLKTRASYLLRWHLLKWFKEYGCKKYDVNSINPEKNPGGYSFKSGLCGNNGEDIRFLGIFDYGWGWRNKLFLNTIDPLINLYRKTKLFVKRQ